MIPLQVPEHLAEEIQLEAEMEGVTVETVLTVAWRRYRTIAQRKKIEAEMAWWENQPPPEHARYIGQHIAVHNKTIVDHDFDPVALHERIRQRFGRIAVLLIPAEGPHEVRMVSFRAETR